MFGFPGETDKEFNETYEFLNKIKFYKMHVFKYSIRKGTKAENMPDQVDNNTKEKRSKLLIELSDKNEKEYLEEYIGKKITVLFEERDDYGYYKGHTSNYLMAKIKTEENVINKMITVIVNSEEKNMLICNY